MAKPFLPIAAAAAITLLLSCPPPEEQGSSDRNADYDRDPDASGNLALSGVS